MRWFLALIAALTALPAAAQLRTVTLGTRSYEIAVPPDAKGPLPLLVALHGGGGNGAQFGRSAGLVERAAREGYVLVLPNGSGRFARMLSWNAGGCCGYARQAGIDDIAFLRAVIADAKRQAKIDPRRVYLAGLSNGGMLTQRAATSLAPELAAATSVVGALFGGETPPATPVPILLIAAENDDRVPVAGGKSSLGLPQQALNLPYLPARAAADFWARADRCGVPTTRETAAYTLTAWTGCAKASEVAFYIAKGLGHGWPGRREAGTFDANDAMFAFFNRHRR